MIIDQSFTIKAKHDFVYYKLFLHLFVKKYPSLLREVLCQTRPQISVTVMVTFLHIVWRCASVFSIVNTVLGKPVAGKGQKTGQSRLVTFLFALQSI